MKKTSQGMTESKPNGMKNNADMPQRIADLLERLTDGIHERDQIMAIALLSAIAGHNAFLFGPPGTAKSLISRRLACAFEGVQYFEYLMNRFSTPEEVFGPVSIKALKEDRYVRKIDGYLPTADFAFLDEIWKASPAILNNLLTIVNEHFFKNGDERIDVPLKILIAASNEVPPENQGLEALYDRFIIRLPVPPIEQEDNFRKLLENKPGTDKPEIGENLRIDYHELAQWREQLHKVNLNQDAMLIIKYIRKALADRFDELGVYVSDRRWQRAAALLKASAFCNGRQETNHSDMILLKYCLWTKPENREAVENLVMEAIRACGLHSDIDLAALDEEKNALDKEINKELYYSTDVYNTVRLEDGEEYFPVSASFKLRHNNHPVRDKEYEIFIPFGKLNDKGEFHPVDKSGNIIREIKCQFDGQGCCKLKLKLDIWQNYHDGDYEDYQFVPEIRFRKGTKKQDVNRKLIKALLDCINEIHQKLIAAHKQVSDKYTNYQKFLQTLFATQTDIDVAVSGIKEQIDRLDLRIKDCERLEALCR